MKAKRDLLKEISLQGHRTLRNVLGETCKFENLERALDEIYSKITEQFKGNLHTHFEVVALSSHDPKIRQIIVEDYQRDIEAVEVFVEEKKKQGAIRTDVDARVLAELFTGVIPWNLGETDHGLPEQAGTRPMDQIHDSDSGKNQNIMNQTRS